MSESSYVATEPPPGEAGLRITRFDGIKVVSEPCFGATEPPPATPDQPGLELGVLSESKLCRLARNVFSFYSHPGHVLE